jgi:anthranilate synthase component II
VPILGVCLGHQAISVAYGGRVVRAARLAHGRAISVQHERQGVFAGLPSPSWFTVYNSLVIDAAAVPECLEVTAWSEDGEVMGLRHRTLDVEGVQFHPEAILSENGLALLANFLERAR